MSSCEKGPGEPKCQCQDSTLVLSTEVVVDVCTNVQDDKIVVADPQAANG